MKILRQLFYQLLLFAKKDVDHLLLEHAVETATDFLTIDELIADYERCNLL